MQDTIRREISINASQQKIYDAIADPEKVIKWFPSTVEGNYSKGHQPIFSFGDHGQNQILVVDAKPHEYFAYRWLPGANNFLGDVHSIKTTLVEFHIKEESPGSCKVTLTESGFSQLPTEIMDDAFKQNSGGWDFMLGRLTSYLNT
jgi:uncharacterized protein YndB with AHSA1/START domain